ncbi:LON peptidase substrate-binding domain-containing protein [Methyloligella sp. 2.7D]|uniref:LON peptidase substrate-binding domain-containing protein n=1 Tax=unclassified Methyloligella TaxID=2625955 RepID=UPI00157BF55F|nr:LON peptidase substrate-binding domain-containing protein [Methyloligella sp. GL2]QKP76247.1 LON peptidase substrate-binding domain-containing protein [Methyloligella sp. GL2]
MSEHYRSPSDLPEILPVFPLSGAILLPRASLTLNVFEPRYLALVDFALRHGRLLSIVQPAPEAGDEESPQGNDFPLRQVACAGRITAFNELEDERLLITITGIARFTLEEISSDYCFRLARPDFGKYHHDFERGYGEDEVDRPQLISTLRSYLDANNLKADWDRINGASNERLVNTLSILSPYGPEEKQALLEAPDLKARAEALIALAEIDLATRDDDTGTSLQ